MARSILSSAWGKFGAAALCVLAGFAILEVAARIMGLVATAPSDARNEIFPEDSARIRILTIGESTTADFFAGSAGTAWPRLLEGKLRKAGVNARVYNEGRGGTSSPLIAYRLPGYLEKYRPQIVVAMMGVNDGSSVQFTGYERSWWARAFLGLRLVKMTYWAFDRLERVGLCEIDYAELDSRNYAGALDAGYAMASRGLGAAEVESEIRRIAKTDDPQTIGIILAALAARLNQPVAAKERRSPGLPYAERAFALHPLNNRVASTFLNYVADKEKGRAASKALLECGKNLPDNLIGQVSTFAAGDATLRAILEERSLAPAESSHTDLTRRHYREIHGLLKDSGIPLVAMQYPTLPVEKLKLVLSAEREEAPPSDIVFVSNQENFERLLESNRYEDIFTDRFGGSWGHTTHLGHDAIADSAMKGILAILAKRIR